MTKKELDLDALRKKFHEAADPLMIKLALFKFNANTLELTEMVGLLAEVVVVLNDHIGSCHARLDALEKEKK